MTRTTPDRTFAAATKQELMRRARSSKGAQRARPPRHSGGIWRQLAITAAVAAVIGGVLAGTGLLHTVLNPTPPAASTATHNRDTDESRPTSGPALIAPPGYRPRSDIELRAWGRTIPNSTGIDRTVWIQQQILITHCMADHGFLFDPIYRYNHAMGALPSGHEQAYEDALNGADPGQPTNWRTLGCTGLAEHQTGHDPTY